jgi:hypothetical protein
MDPGVGRKDWQHIAEQASMEMDPAKLIILLRKLCRALDREHDENSRHLRLPENGPQHLASV